MTQRRTQYNPNNNAQRPRNSAEGRGRRTTIKVLTSVICVFLVVLIGTGTYALVLYNRMKNDPTSFFTHNPEPIYTPVTGEDEHVFRPTIRVETDEGHELTGVYDEKIINFAILGVDTASFRSIADTGYQSDVMILVSYNTTKEKISMISIPRDTKAKIRKLDSSGNPTGTITTKINAAYSYGGGRTKYSYNNACHAMSQFLGGIPVQHFIGLDMDGVPRIVDSVGGVEMTLDYSFTSVDSSMTKGKTMRLNGRQALTYVRERKLSGMDGSDTARVLRQQRFLKAFAAEVKQQNVDVLLNQVYPSVAAALDTNMNLEQLGALLMLLNGYDLETMDMYSVPGHWDGTYWVANQKEMDAIIYKVFYEE